MEQLPPVKDNIDRRKFISLLLTAGAVLGGLRYLTQKKTSVEFRKMPGKMIGANFSRGHLLRDGKIPEPTHTYHKDFVIIGAGVSGLSAARMLYKHKQTDFEVIELDDQIGGNSKSGVNEVTSYPWGAHYLPIPDPSLTELIDFLKEHDVIQKEENGLPVYNDYYLCADPHERLFINGYWQEGIIPDFGVSEQAKEEFKRFFEYVEKLKEVKGKDGFHAFSIPVARSSSDEEFRMLDRISFEEYLLKSDYKSNEFHWYMNYCCRDDYGTRASETSAWAGIHYFAGRKGKAANAPGSSVLTWPEGNMFLVNALIKGFEGNVSTGKMCFRITETLDSNFQVDLINFKSNKAERIICKKCILAIPSFVANKLLKSVPASSKSTYSTWMVANLTLKYDPGGNGSPLSWDNVIYDSPSLGYVNAGNQLLSRQLKKVLTYYLPLVDDQPSNLRKKIQNKTHEEWCQDILKDLKKVHKNIEELTENIDIMIWGHAMIRPVPDFIWNDSRTRSRESEKKNLVFAHTDLSGISIFEEAFYQGIIAANKLMGIPTS